MKAFTTALALALCVGAPVAYAQMDEAQSQEARAALNSQEAAAAQQQLSQDVASRDVYQAEEATRDAQIARRDLNYEAALDAHRASLRDYHAALRDWRANIAACEDGDWSRCGGPGPVQ